MWEKDNNEYNPGILSYKNSNSLDSVKSIGITTYTTGEVNPDSGLIGSKEYKKLAISFRHNKELAATELLGNTIEACPSKSISIENNEIDSGFSVTEYSQIYYNTIDISINYSQLLQQDLEIFFNYLLEHDIIPKNIIEELKEKITAKEITISEQQFYDSLPNLSEDNFDKLFDLAKQSCSNTNANPLWRLANSCQNIGLIYQRRLCLLAITKNTNFYEKAQSELFWDKLAEVCDTSNRENIDNVDKEQYRKLLQHLSESPEDDIMVKNIKHVSLLFLNKNPLNDASEIFTTFNEDNPESQTNENFFFYYLTDLLEYTKNLQEKITELEQQNTALQQRLNLSGEQQNNHTETEPVSDPKPKLKFKI
jgi:hypothetical protein